MKLRGGFGTSSGAALMATVTVGAVSTWAATAIKANTAAVGAAFRWFLLPQISLYRQTVTTIGIGPFSSNGATMKAATAMNRCTINRTDLSP